MDKVFYFIGVFIIILPVMYISNLEKDVLDSNMKNKKSIAFVLGALSIFILFFGVWALDNIFHLSPF